MIRHFAPLGFRMIPPPIRVTRKKWQVDVDGKWQTIFSKTRFKKDTVRFNDYHFILVPWERCLISKEWQYKYYLVPKDDPSSVFLDKLKDKLMSRIESFD